MARTRVEKVNAELVTLTYGTMVAQLCSDLDNNYSEVNKQLDKMGYNIGMRLVEDFFAKSGVQRCLNLRETAETISKVREISPLEILTFSINILKGDELYMILGEADWLADRLQDVSEHYSHGYQLDQRQQTIFPGL